MKKLARRVLASLLLAVLLLLGSAAYAQRTEKIIKVNIPFEFTVGNRVFPAGRYSLLRVDPSVLELRDSEGQVLLNVLTQSVEASTKPDLPRLLFNSEGGRHVLTQVWQENESIGQQIPQSNAATRAVRKRSGHVQTAKAGNPR